MLVEPLHQLLFALPVDDEHDGPAARLQKSEHPVVCLPPLLVDLELGNHFSFLVYFEALSPECFLHVFFFNFE